MPRYDGPASSGAQTAAGRAGMFNFGANNFVNAANFVLDSGDRRRQRRREDRMRQEDRRYYIADRENERNYARHALQRLRVDAEAAGIHPLAALGAQVAGPATAFQSQNYDSGGYGPRTLPFTDPSTSRLNDAQASLLEKQGDLIDLQIGDAIIARTAASMSNDKMAAPNEVIPQQYTPVVDHALFGKPIKSDPTIADAQSHTQRYGESELYETLLAAIINFKDWMYTETGKDARQRKEEAEKARKDFFDKRKNYFRFD